MYGYYDDLNFDLDDYEGEPFLEYSKVNKVPNNHFTADPSLYKDHYIIGSLNKKTGAFSVAVNPARHRSREEAKTEAARLAKQDNQKMFVVLLATDIATVQDVVFL